MISVDYALFVSVVQRVVQSPTKSTRVDFVGDLHVSRVR